MALTGCHLVTLIGAEVMVNVEVRARVGGMPCAVFPATIAG